MGVLTNQMSGELNGGEKEEEEEEQRSTHHIGII